LELRVRGVPLALRAGYCAAPFRLFGKVTAGPEVTFTKVSFQIGSS